MKAPGTSSAGRPPRLARWILRTLSAPRHRETLEADFEELFTERESILGWRAARWRAFCDALSAVRTRFSSVAGDHAQVGPRVGAVSREPFLRMRAGDFQVAARGLRANPGLTMVCILTLALGIGMNTAIFSAVYGLLLRPLPFREADSIVSLSRSDRRYADAYTNVAPADFLDWQERAQSLSQFSVVEPWSFEMLNEGEPTYVRASRVSASFFSLLGVQPLHGRLFLPEEYQLGNTDVVLLSHAVWRRRFGADPAVIGRTLILENRAHQVAGVLPPAARLRLFAQDEEMWTPLYFHDALRQQRAGGSWRVLARLKPGVTVAAAQAEMDTLAAQISAEHPRTHRDVGISVVALHDFLVGRARPALLLLLAAVTLVLFIACGNIANLLLARGNERQREWSIRAALGAGRGRLAALPLAESMLLPCWAGLRAC